MIKMKKAQGQIITTILIILLVLAAVVIIWRVVSNTVQRGSDEIASQTDCIGINLEVLKADSNGNDVDVTRKLGGGSDDLKNIKILVDSKAVNHDCEGTASNNNCTLGLFETKTYNINGADPLTTANQLVEVFAELSDGTFCEASASIESI